MELSWWSVIGTSSHAAAALIIWLTATASFLVRSIFFARELTFDIFFSSDVILF
jgi:hypothetical protein